MAEHNHEKTEQPTARRRQRARAQGEVVRSRELHSAVVLLAAVLSLNATGTWMLHEFANRWEFSFSTLAETSLTTGSVAALTTSWMAWAAKLLLPPFAIIATAAIVSGFVLQGGFVISSHGITPDWKRVDPVAGFQRLFSGRAGWTMLRDVLKIALVTWVAFIGVRNAIDVFANEADVGISMLWVRAAHATGTIALRSALILVFIGLLDYAFQRHQYNQQLRMTKQEVREELKETEGNPQMKSRIRSRQRELSRRRMLEAVPTADVVLTNPTTLAIALKYDAKTMQAPQVVAKGQRLIAERIKSIAREHGVPVIEDKPLARSLFRLAEVGGEIPVELYRAVAEILGFVYRQRGATKRGET